MVVWSSVSQSSPPSPLILNFFLFCLQYKEEELEDDDAADERIRARQDVEGEEDVFDPVGFFKFFFVRIFFVRRKQVLHIITSFLLFFQEEFEGDNGDDGDDDADDDADEGNGGGGIVIGTLTDTYPKGPLSKLRMTDEPPAVDQEEVRVFSLFSYIL